MWVRFPSPAPLFVDGVLSVQPGQRVAWVYAPGSYAERIALSADALVRVPDAIDDRTAAAVMMQGLTASHFATDFYPVRRGDVAFVHAAAGGVGLLLTHAAYAHADVRPHHPSLIDRGNHSLSRSWPLQCF